MSSKSHLYSQKVLWIRIEGCSFLGGEYIYHLNLILDLKLFHKQVSIFSSRNMSPWNHDLSHSRRFIDWATEVPLACLSSHWTSQPPPPFLGQSSLLPVMPTPALIWLPPLEIHSSPPLPCTHTITELHWASPAPQLSLLPPMRWLQQSLLQQGPLLVLPALKALCARFFREAFLQLVWRLNISLSFILALLSPLLFYFFFPVSLFSLPCFSLVQGPNFPATAKAWGANAWLYPVKVLQDCHWCPHMCNYLFFPFASWHLTPKHLLFWLSRPQFLPRDVLFIFRPSHSSFKLGGSESPMPF